MSIAVTRVKHQIIQRASAIRVPNTAKIVVSKNKVADLQQIKSPSKQQSLLPTPPKQPPPKQPPTKRTLKKQIINQGPKVKHNTRNPPPESMQKIQKIKGIGKNKALLIIGNGPSILQAELQKLKNIPNIDILSINKPDLRVWPTTYWSFFDGSQIRRHADIWESYNGTIFNSTSITKQKASSIMFKNIGGSGFSKDLIKGLHIGRSSVYASMQIALWMGYLEIYIFGVDMNPDGIDGKLHFYGTNPDVDPKIRATRFKNEAEYYDKAAQILTDEERSRFVFCSKGINPWPFIDKYNNCSHIEAADIILSKYS